jgi:hypothetical protein
VKDADVRIVPPYKADNIQGDPKAMDHIKKLVSVLFMSYSYYIRNQGVLGLLQCVGCR